MAGKRHSLSTLSVPGTVLSSFGGFLTRVRGPVLQNIRGAPLHAAASSRAPHPANCAGPGRSWCRMPGQLQGSSHLFPPFSDNCHWWPGALAYNLSFHLLCPSFSCCLQKVSPLSVLLSMVPGRSRHLRKRCPGFLSPRTIANITGSEEASYKDPAATAAAALLLLARGHTSAFSPHSPTWERESRTASLPGTGTGHSRPPACGREEMAPRARAPGPKHPGSSGGPSSPPTGTGDPAPSPASAGTRHTPGRPRAS